MNLLFQLDAAYFRQMAVRFRNNPREWRKPLFVALGIAFYLWWMVFRHVAEDKAGFLSNWPHTRYLFPLIAAGAAALMTSHELITRWLTRWAGGSWGTMAVRPRDIAGWLVQTMLLVDAAFVVLAIVVSIGLSYLTGLDWWAQFPFLIVGTALVVALISSAKIMVVVWLRLAGPPVIYWPRIVLRLLTSSLAVLIIQPLAAFWWIAEFGRQQGTGVAATISLLVLSAGAVGMALAAQKLVAAKWGAIVYSFELQHTQAKAVEAVRIANLLAKPARTPVTRLVTFYNLRSGNVGHRWGRTINLGGRRVHAFMILFGLVAFLFIVPFLASLENPETVPMAFFYGGWCGLLSAVTIPDSEPVFRLLRMLPVSFAAWLRSMAAFPLAVTAGGLIVSCALLTWVDPPTALRSCAIAVGMGMGIFPLRLLVKLALPHSREAAEWIFMGTVGAAVVLFLYVTPIATVLMLLGADIYFFTKAEQEWRRCEEGLHV